MVINRVVEAIDRDSRSGCEMNIVMRRQKIAVCLLKYFDSGKEIYSESINANLNYHTRLQRIRNS